MLDFYAKILQVINLEKEKGYQNSAVAGGFENFVGFIEMQADQFDLEKEITNLFINFFKSYSHYHSRIDKNLLTSHY